jgi:hypothetical protein
MLKYTKTKYAEADFNLCCGAFAHIKFINVNWKLLKCAQRGEQNYRMKKKVKK